MSHEIIFALDLITEVKESGTVGMHWSSKPSFSIFSGKFKFLFTRGICCTACLKKIWNKFLITLETQEYRVWFLPTGRKTLRSREINRTMVVCAPGVNRTTEFLFPHELRMILRF
jgi:hypothetical protein